MLASPGRSMTLNIFRVLFREALNDDYSNAIRDENASSQNRACPTAFRWCLGTIECDRIHCLGQRVGLVVEVRQTDRVQPRAVFHPVQLNWVNSFSFPSSGVAYRYWTLTARSMSNSGFSPLGGSEGCMPALLAYGQ
ncbi:uncharacterized protein LOC131214419 [Anopheles bellator]|uniref:uncharacterized protein LOC131214419 n=1 Tax=Anopheles bellator TaxID=139047 RepID=UPI002649C13B|nr:uncharacterized protein LOC131214419 [Anopheles bellator]